MKRTKVIITSTITAAILGTLLAAPANAAIPTENLEQASLGDSITRGSAIGGRSSSGGGIHNPAANWSTGTDSRVTSHLQRLTTLKNVTVQGYNYSVGGTTSSAIAGQASNVAPTVDYTTILTGGNDICQANTLAELPSKETYKANVQAGVDVLLSKNPEMVVGLASVPKIQRLYEVGKTSTLSNLYHSSNQICRIGLGSYSGETTTQANARRAAVDARVQAYNDVLEEIANSYPTVYYDNDAVYNTAFVLADISTADYFHPSYSGHQKIAAGTWNAFASQGAFDKKLVAPTITLASSATVSKTTQIAVTATSDVNITTVSAYVPALNQTIPLGLATDGKYKTPAINTTTYPNGTYNLVVTATDSDSDVTTATYKITVKN